jgi:SAM-dependent methyltransferase
VSRPLVAPRAVIRQNDGIVRQLNVERWLSEADSVDLRLLSRASGPVLDVGCGPGRHVEALRLQSIHVLGIDLSPDFVALAQRLERPVILQSVFDVMPDEIQWQCALILDGSIGIGGNPQALLQQVGKLLGGDGRVLIETGHPDERSEELVMLIEDDNGTEVSFRWATLSAEDTYQAAQASGFTVSEVWHDGGRWFAQLDKQPG